MTRSTLDQFLDGLMRRYRERVPDVQAIIDCMLADGLIDSYESIENDHIAFRTMGVSPLGISSLEKVFLAHGYERKESYHFPGKKLDAWWYAPPTPAYPRVFISELRVGDLSPKAQQIIRSYTDTVAQDPVDQIDLQDGAAIDRFLHSPLWHRPTWDDYTQLAEESEYASWVIYNRYYLNHFTISVHNLPAPYDTIARFNDYVEAHGFTLNPAGGKIKTSGDGLLIQSSTVARQVEAKFDDGEGGTRTESIPGSYIEFAERRVLPEFADLPPEAIERKHRRDGFEASNADKIFESTYTRRSE